MKYTILLFFLSTVVLNNHGMLRKFEPIIVQNLNQLTYLNKHFSLLVNKRKEQNSKDDITKKTKVIINKLKKFKHENRYINKMHDITLIIDKKTIYANTFDELHAELLTYFTDHNKDQVAISPEEILLNNLSKTNALLYALLGNDNDHCNFKKNFGNDHHNFQHAFGNNMPKNIYFTFYAQNKPKKFIIGLFNSLPDYQVKFSTKAGKFIYYRNDCVT